MTDKVHEEMLYRKPIIPSYPSSYLFCNPWHMEKSEAFEFCDYQAALHCFMGEVSSHRNG